MKLEQLRIKGFMRFQDAVELDLTTIPDGSLVAVVGANGQGKSTLLDAGAAVLHLAMPSREGALATYATRRDSYLEARYVIEGQGTFRCRVNVDGDKRTSDAVLEQLVDGTARRLSDGKVTTYRTAIDGLFPPKELLLASAFAPQNRAGSFVTAKPAQRKDLFSRLLGLELYERYAETAKACAAIVETTAARLQDRRDALARGTAPAIAEDLERRGRQLQEDRDDAARVEQRQRALIAERQVERVALEEAVEAHRAAQQRALTAASAVSALTTAQTTNKAQHEQASEAYQGVVARSEATLKRALATITADEDAAKQAWVTTTEGLSRKIAGNQTLSARADEIRAAANAQDDTERRLTELREQHVATRRRLAQAGEQVSLRRDRLTAAQSAAYELAQARRQADLLSSVPCEGRSISVILPALGRDGEIIPTPLRSIDAGACQFLQDAKAAAARIPELEHGAREAGTLQQGIEHWSEQHRTIDAELQALDLRVERHQAALLDLAKTAKYVTELAATEERIAGYRRELDAATQTRNTALDRLALARVTAVRQAEAEQSDAAIVLDLRTDALTAEATDLTQQLVDAQRTAEIAQVDAQASAGAVLDLQALDLVLEAAREALTVAVSTRARAAAALDAWSTERAAFARQVVELETIAAKVTVAEDELLAWQTLQRCFSRDGLPTLEIGNAGPTVSALTNDLLNVGFGPRFTVDVVTQTARADGKGLKEEFTIRVFDNADGGEPRDIADLSGGERVLVEEALRAAIALFVNSRNVQPVRTIWRDETTGALDPENAVRYVAMLRRVQQLGGIAHVLFVTHNPECADLADVQVRVHDGQIDIVRPPFRQAA